MLKRSFLQSLEVVEEIKVVTYIMAKEIFQQIYCRLETKHTSRSDRELHGKCLISAAQDEIPCKRNIQIKV
jgi:aconitase B